MSEKATPTENGKRGMTEPVAKQRESKIVTGTCNHYFSVYRRLRHWDQKTRLFSIRTEAECKSGGESARHGQGGGTSSIRSKSSQPQQSSKNKWVSAFRGVKAKPDSIRLMSSYSSSCNSSPTSKHKCLIKTKSSTHLERGPKTPPVNAEKQQEFS